MITEGGLILTQRRQTTVTDDLSTGPGRAVHSSMASATVRHASDKAASERFLARCGGPLGAHGLLGGLVVGASLFRPATCTASDDTHLLLENDTLTMTFGQFSQDVAQRLQREISKSELQDAKDKCYEDNEASHQQWVVLSRF